jgi:hypothetical protein
MPEGAVCAWNRAGESYQREIPLPVAGGGKKILENKELRRPIYGVSGMAVCGLFRQTETVVNRCGPGFRLTGEHKTSRQQPLAIFWRYGKEYAF